MKSKIVFHIARFAAAGILLQTLFFKFSGASESVWIFTQLGVEPFGRIGSGIVELIAAILLISGKYSRWGALLAGGTMFGAVFSHIFVLGLEVQNDGGFLFILAVIVLVCSFFVFRYPVKRIETKM